MSLVTIFLLALGLSADTFAVSITCGLAKTKIRFFQATRIAFFMAFFQAAMPVAGWLFGREIKEFMETFDHWIAFALLSILGMKMIAEALSDKHPSKKINPLDIKIILWISLATSIDALVVGISIAMLDVEIVQAVAGIFIIGAVTFIAAMLGILFGKKTGQKFGRKVEFAGGFILIAIGVKILLEHLV